MLTYDFYTLLGIPILQNKFKESNEIDYGSVSRSENQEAVPTPVKYPVGVVFVLISKAFESFSANGVRSEFD